MTEHTVPPLTLGDPCRSGRPYPHTYDAQCVSGFDLPGGESTSAMLRRVQADLAASQADLTRAEQQRDQALAESERREETVARNVFERDRWHGVAEMLREQRDLARAELASSRKETLSTRTSRDAIWHERNRLLDVTRNQYAEIQQLRGQIARLTCPNPITEGAPTMTTTNPGGEGGSAPTVDPMIDAAAEALWPHLPGEVQDGYMSSDINPWAASTAAAALRVMADEIDRGPTFPLPPSVISALVRERAEGLTA